MVASPDDETNLIAVAVLTEALGRDHVYLLSSEASLRHDHRDRNVEAWTQRPFSSSATLEQLQRITGDFEVRTVTASTRPPGAVILAEVHADGGWTVHPGQTPAPHARLIIAEPLPAPQPAPAPTAPAEEAPLAERGWSTDWRDGRRPSFLLTPSITRRRRSSPAA